MDPYRPTAALLHCHHLYHHPSHYRWCGDTPGRRGGWGDHHHHHHLPPTYLEEHTACTDTAVLHTFLLPYLPLDVETVLHACLCLHLDYPNSATTTWWWGKLNNVYVPLHCCPYTFPSPSPSWDHLHILQWLPAFGSYRFCPFKLLASCLPAIYFCAFMCGAYTHAAAFCLFAFLVACLCYAMLKHLCAHLCLPTFSNFHCILSFFVILRAYIKYLPLLPHHLLIHRFKHTCAHTIPYHHILPYHTQLSHLHTTICICLLLLPFLLLCVTLSLHTVPSSTTTTFTVPFLLPPPITTTYHI